jgi:hypothetical protein
MGGQNSWHTDAAAGEFTGFSDADSWSSQTDFDSSSGGNDANTWENEACTVTAAWNDDFLSEDGSNQEWTNSDIAHVPLGDETPADEKLNALYLNAFIRSSFDNTHAWSDTDAAASNADWSTTEEVVYTVENTSEWTDSLSGVGEPVFVAQTYEPTRNDSYELTNLQNGTWSQVTTEAVLGDEDTDLLTASGTPLADRGDASVPETEESVLQSGLQAPLAAGIFQELRYPILQNLPGPTAGTTARFDLSFRDFSGFPNPTSHAYLNRTVPPPGNRWKGLRLDFGPNPRTGATDWHWNQSGAGNSFGIADHTPASAFEANFGRMMQIAKPVGRAAMWTGVAFDTFSLGSEVVESTQTGEWSNTIVEGARVAGGWGGAWAGAQGGGMAGAALGTAIFPGIGTAVGGFLGSVIGGAGGYFAGSELAETVAEQTTGYERPNE